AQLDEEQQNQPAKFFLFDFEEMRRPGCAGVPKQESRAEIEQGEYEADDKCAEEKVPEKDDLLAFHGPIIYSSDTTSITNGFATLIDCRFCQGSGMPRSVKAKASASIFEFGFRQFQ